MLTAERLRELLDYDPATGVFTWRVRAGRSAAGREAGWIQRYRKVDIEYRDIRVDGRTYRAHRLAFLWMTGSFPDCLVDHRDGDGLNNRWRNLRCASHAQNHQNRRMDSRNSCGLKGVERNGPGYSARIGVNGTRLYLGYFDTPEAAHAAYVAAAQHHFGEFARAA
jgi:hypothetical protein